MAAVPSGKQTTVGLPGVPRSLSTSDNEAAYLTLSSARPPSSGVPKARDLHLTFALYSRNVFHSDPYQQTESCVPYVTCHDVT